jgi:ABC-type bacteriocin/lantibiotic exporter with double-glycine peptidase domain
MMQAEFSRKRSWLVPEVVQTSAMDCGPAVLKCLLAGYGIGIHYGRLREACQTDLDGTSVDTLEEVANRLGLLAEQVMLPPDQVLLPELRALPAILIVRLPNNATHFVLIWRRLGPVVQVMDPATGRRWMTCRQLINQMYVHRQRVPALAWREWAESEEMQALLSRRLKRLGLGRRVQPMRNEALKRSGWQAIARLDAAARVVESLVASGGLSRGAAATRALKSLIDLDFHSEGKTSILPDRFWSVRHCPSAGACPEDSDEQLWLSGAVLVRVKGRSVNAPTTGIKSQQAHTSSESQQPVSSRAENAPGLELQAALTQRESSPLLKILELVRGTGWISLMCMLFGLVLAAVGAIAETVVMRGLLDLRRDLAVVEQRLVAMGCIALFGLGLMLLEFRLTAGLYRLGRRLEIGLRVAFLRKIPRLHDRYFQSRPTSDMAERGHSIHVVRSIPRISGQILRATAAILLTAAAIAWIEPAATWLACAAAAVAVLLPFLFLPLLQGLDLRVRTHVGGLTRFTFDTLLGLAAVRAHVANQAVSIEHEGLLVEWARASLQLLKWRVVVNGLQAFVGISLAACLLMIHASRAADVMAVLLLAYWALSIATLGDEIVGLIGQYPSIRSVTLRLLEPLGAPEQDLLVEKSPPDVASMLNNQHPVEKQEPPVCNLTGVSICLRDVQVRAAGHSILESISLAIEPGSHLAIVGPSGAGKSSLVGLLLGWHQAAKGEILVDGVSLDSKVLCKLREKTVWVDPTVQLWNRSLLDNLLYGNPDAGLNCVGDVLQQAQLVETLQRLPDGLQTILGEGGGLLSGGEAQRVKFGRGLARYQPRLVILDEPFRGLERRRRRELLELARNRWKSATLILITHDVTETLDFPRVLVLDSGRLVEDAAPTELMAPTDSLYQSLLDAEDAVRRRLWESESWRRIELSSGRVVQNSIDKGDSR